MAGLVENTAWVLGNGPTLPVADLHRLSGQLTIGVNRILRSGFSPTLIVFNDPEVMRDDQALFDEYAGQIISNKHWRHNAPSQAVDRTWWLPTVTGLEMGAAQHLELRADRLYINGNSAVGAALLALACGCREVHMLGCGCEAVDGASHFYGAHPDWDERYQIPEDIPTIMRIPMERLLRAYPDRVIVDDEIPISVGPAAISQECIVNAIKAAINSRGDVTVA